MRGNVKCKNSRFEPPFGGLMGNAQGSSMARWKRIADFLLATIELFLASSHGYGSEICWNRRFLTGVGHFERKY